MTCTRPDLSWIVSKLSQYLSDPYEQHWSTVKHVMRYLKGTIDHELCYKKSDEKLKLVAYSDADWASDLNDRRSTTGYCFSLTQDGPLISWKSKKQSTVALSTCEAECIALAVTAQESMYLVQLLNSMENDCLYIQYLYKSLKITKVPLLYQRTQCVVKDASMSMYDIISFDQHSVMAK